MIPLRFRKLRYSRSVEIWQRGLATPMMIDLLTAQLPLIKAAAGALDFGPIRRYARLRELLGSDRSQARKTFEAEFTAYYGLNAGGVTPRFREVYYDRLYAFARQGS